MCDQACVDARKIDRGGDDDGQHAMVLPKSLAKDCDLRSEEYDFRCERIVIVGCVELLAETCVLRSEGVVFRFERDVSRGACPTSPGGLRPLVALFVGHFGSQSGLDDRMPG